MTRHAAWHMWRLREADDKNLGLAFSDHGLLIGRTPLIEKHDGQFVMREQRDIERLLSSAYRSEVSANGLMSGLATVARALNANDQCLARIAAVHLRVPDIADRAARDAMEAMDVFIKYARYEGGGDSDWNPALHPRAGTPPNPGWFAPTGGSADEPLPVRTAQNDNPAQRSDASTKTNDDWVRLPPPPHTRIDELADLLEWIANAKPEDEATIRAEINRYYLKHEEGVARDLQSWLSVILRPGTTKETRQKILNIIDKYSWNDPADVAGVTEIVNDLTGVAAGLPPATAGTRSAEEAARQSRAATEIVPRKSRQPTLHRKFGNTAGPREVE